MSSFKIFTAVCGFLFPLLNDGYGLLPPAGVKRYYLPSLHQLPNGCSHCGVFKCNVLVETEVLDVTVGFR